MNIYYVNFQILSCPLFTGVTREISWPRGGQLGPWHQAQMVWKFCKHRHKMIICWFMSLCVYKDEYHIQCVIYTEQKNAEKISLALAVLFFVVLVPIPNKTKAKLRCRKFEALEPASNCAHQLFCSTGYKQSECAGFKIMNIMLHNNWASFLHPLKRICVKSEISKAIWGHPMMAI